MIRETELKHYGVRGMKWGHRKIKYTNDGSSRTVKKLKKFLDTDKKYGSNRTIKQDKKINRLYKKYDKSASKDIKKLIKNGDTKTLNSISAGRTYLKMLNDSNYLNTAITQTAVKSNIQIGEDFAYKYFRDNERGGVTVDVNGHKETYVYMPEFKK